MMRNYEEKTCWSGAQPILAIRNDIAHSCGRGAAHQSTSDKREHFNVVFYVQTRALHPIWEDRIPTVARPHKDGGGCLRYDYPNLGTIP